MEMRTDLTRRATLLSALGFGPLCAAVEGVCGDNSEDRSVIDNPIEGVPHRASITGWADIRNGKYYCDPPLQLHGFRYVCRCNGVEVDNVHYFDIERGFCKAYIKVGDVYEHIHPAMDSEQLMAKLAGIWEKDHVEILDGVLSRTYWGTITVTDLGPIERVEEPT